MTGDSSEGAALHATQPPGSQPQDLRAGRRCMPPATAFPRPGRRACGRRQGREGPGAGGHRRKRQARAGHGGARVHLREGSR